MIRRLVAALMLSVLIVGAAPSVIAIEPADTEDPKGTYVAPIEGTTVNIGDTYKMNFSATDNVGVTDAVVYLDGVRVNSGEKGMVYKLTTWAGDPATTKHFELDWDLTEIGGGTYKFQTYLSDAAGNEALAQTNSKTDYITFISSANKKVTPPPPSAGAPTTSASTCSVSQEEFNEVLEPILGRVKKQQRLLDQTYAKVETKLGPEKAPDTLGNAELLKETAEKNITELDGLKVDCSKDPRSDMDTFKATLEEVEHDLTSYREELQEVIGGING